MRSYHPLSCAVTDLAACSRPGHRYLSRSRGELPDWWMPCGLPQVRHEVDTYLRTLERNRYRQPSGACRNWLVPHGLLSVKKPPVSPPGTFNDLMISIAMKLGLEGSNC